MTSQPNWISNTYTQFPGDQLFASLSYKREEVLRVATLSEEYREAVIRDFDEMANFYNERDYTPSTLIEFIKKHNRLFPREDLQQDELFQELNRQK